MDEGFGSMRDLYEKARKVDVGINFGYGICMDGGATQQANKKLQELQFLRCTVSQVWIPNWLDGCHHVGIMAWPCARTLETHNHTRSHTDDTWTAEVCSGSTRRFICGSLPSIFWFGFSAEYTWGTPCFSIITLWKYFKQRAVFLSHKRLSRIVVCPASVCSRYCRYPPISGHVRVLGLQVMSCCTSCTCCMWFSSFYCALF